MTITSLPKLAEQGRCTTNNVIRSTEMTNSEERKIILRMIEEGKVSAEEGARLLAAMNTAGDEAIETVNVSAPGISNRFLHVRVTDLVTGKQKVRVNIPTSLVSFGLRFVPKNQEVDVQSIQEAIDTGYTGLIVDVYDEEDGNHVEVYLE